MDWIAAHAEFASMAEMIQGQQDGTRTKLMVHITFDDAYGENCEFAIPELVRRRIPTTYFVATSFVESGRSFPHDLSRGKPLRPNTKAEIGQMASQGIVIGAHSHTHLDFGQDLPHSILVSEIRDVRKKLQDWTGQSIDYFAFPYGQVKNISQAALDMVFASGYQVAVSAYGGFNFPGGDDRHLQRIHGDPGMAALKNWLTFDPRKMRKRIRFPFDTSKHPLPFESSLSADRPENAMQLSTPS
jgi:peptidoglycan/xylan/chitin deacetylase (PgdA/CDA1 family)